MSDEPGAGGFRYGDQSLDELRALAGSVDVGRIAETQQHFASVAEQVDQVVGGLVALRKELPGWWEGAASEAALGAFDQVISHAQTTHEVASGAAIALKTCAAVAGEQQAAMAAVPEVAMPTGVGAVVPTSPFAAAALGPMVGQEPLARYSSARERAAGVVSGIAAQFVETRAQLVGLTADVYDENFQQATPVPSSASILRTAPVTASQISTASYLAPVTPVTLGVTLGARDPGSTLSARSIPDISSLWQPTRSPRLAHHSETSTNITNPAAVEDSKLNSFAKMAPESTLPWSAENSLQVGRYSGKSVTEQPAVTGRLSIEPNSVHEKPHRSMQVDAYTSTEVANEKGTDSHKPPEPHAHYDEVSQPQFSNSGVRIGTIRPEVTPENSLDSNSSMSSGTSMRSANTSMRAGENGLGILTAGSPVQEGEEERGRRPDYLKEAADTWVTDQMLAPSNGILTPDWANSS